MAINNFKPFALDPNANVTSQADWEALPALLSGFTAGKASSAQVNKAIRQASFIAAALAQYTANKSGLDVLDDGDLNGFISKMGTAFGKDFQALDATLSALAGLATGANKLPYFTGNDTAAQTDLTSVGRDIIGKNTIADILTYLGLTNAIIGDTCKEAGFYSGSALAPYLMHEDTHTPIRLVTLDSVHRVTTTTYTINYYANGLIHILGMTPTVSSLTPKTMTFPVAFPNACIRFALHNQESGVPSYNMAMYSNLSRTGAKIWGVANILGNSGSPTLGALPDAEISYEAWGY
ncbi:hypothetical protein L1045_03090 [Escherichia coli]|uniref:gp53-like domain-containing protein n=1 Tax=Escherichia coli TaxID=562 RepID=UPI001F412F49|nr:hypothetical protein [Escherichia coli]MCF3430420.1 hypothetical protein [Escherichia coli]